MREIGGESRRLDPRDYQFISDRYDGGVWYADAALGGLFDALAERGLLDDTLVVVTADHGESLTEREACYFTHDPFLFEETLWVPLIARFPGRLHGGRRVEEVARGVDVLPTLLDVCGLSLGSDLQGASLVPLVEGNDPGRETWHFAQTQTHSAKETDRRDREGWLEERLSLTDGRVKLIRDRTADTWALFDLKVDPGETRDLSGDPAWRERLGELQALVDYWRQSVPQRAAERAELSEDTRRMLERMGYVETDG